MFQSRSDDSRSQEAAGRPVRHDIDSYVAGKTDAILDILRHSGFPADVLEVIARANRKGG